MKAHLCDTNLAPSKLAIRSESHTISKQKPKIRIVHIVAPEIIKTNVENFRELVQRLTGKPLGKNSSNTTTTSGKIKKGKNVSSLQNKKKPQSATLQKGDNSSTLLSFLGEVQGFMHDVHEFPLLPFRSSQLNTVAEMPHL